MTSNTTDDKVLDHTRQQLSALFDGELGLDEARFLQRRLEHDAGLAASWSRWQLAGDVLRGQATAPAPADFAGRVAAAVAAESAGTRAGRAGAPGRRRGLLLPGAALAASVAALAMFIARQGPEPAFPAGAAMEIASAADTVPAQPLPAAPSAPASPTIPDTALQVAGTAIAVAEAPRRAAERRSRGQQQRAAATREQRNAAAPALVAAAGGGTVDPAPADTVANPFVPEAAAEAIATRPWPRALLRGGGGAFTVGYGRLPLATADVHPFQPRPVALPRADTATDSPLAEDTD